MHTFWLTCLRDLRNYLSIGLSFVDEWWFRNYIFKSSYFYQCLQSLESRSRYCHHLHSPTQNTHQAATNNYNYLHYTKFNVDGHEVAANCTYWRINTLTPTNFHKLIHHNTCGWQHWEIQFKGLMHQSKNWRQQQQQKQHCPIK